MRAPMCLATVCVVVLAGGSAAMAEPEKDGKTLTEWRKQLKTSADAKDRAQAAEAIGTIGEEARVAIDDLLAAVNDREYVVRQFAVEAVGRIGERLKGEGPEIQKAFPILLAGLKDNKAPDDRNVVRLEFIRALPRMSAKDPQIAKTLVTGLLPFFKDRDPAVRKEVAEDLCRYLEDTEFADLKGAVSPEVVKLLRDSSEDVRNGAKDSLPRIDPETAKKLGIDK